MTIGRRRRAFTLLEVLLVMAIIVIIMAVAYPSMEAWWADTRVQAASDDVRGAWAEARTRAIDSGIPYRFAVKPNTEKYRIAPDLPESWDGSGANSDIEFDDGKVMVGSLPQSILFTPDGNSTASSGGWTTVVTFLPDGSCQDDGLPTHKVTLSADGCQPLVISVRTLTGNTRVQPQNQVGR